MESSNSESEDDIDEPNPHMLAFDSYSSASRGRSFSPSRRPSESKSRSRKNKSKCICTNARVAIFTVMIFVIFIFMYFVVMSMRDPPNYKATNILGHLQQTHQAVCPECQPCAATLVCPICVDTSSSSTAEVLSLQSDLHDLRMQYQTLLQMSRRNPTGDKADHGKVAHTLQTDTVPPDATQRKHGKLIGAGDPYEVTGDDVIIDLNTHLVSWTYCTTKDGKLYGTHQLCPNRANSEQGFQLSFYDQWDRNGRVVPLSKRPSYPSCIQRLPAGYVFPPKQRPSLPHTVGIEHWGNFGSDISKLEDLIVFNPTALKNLYHFDAARYDMDFEHHVRFGAKFIPLASKVRLALDVGSGGGSFGLWLKQKYDIQTLSIAFPDWPYCEYISMRGNLCMYVDAFHAMPFSKFTFDLVHVSWIYHSMDPPELEKAFLEVYRITRPGGYMWLQDGHSLAQVATQQRLIRMLGLVKLFEHQVPHKEETSFGNNPYQLQWWTILLKPIRENDTTNTTVCNPL